MKIDKDINKTIFREYDVRGEYLTMIDEDAAYSIGIAFGTKIKSLGKTTCVVGHDNRLSGEELTNALIEGIKSTGIDIYYLGLVTTPMYYFGCIHLRVDSGIMVTASHNPVQDNGFKIALQNFDNACGDSVKELYRIIQDGPYSKGEGKVTNYDIKKEYLKTLLANITLEKRLKVVVDTANATPSIIIKDVFDNINADVIYLNEVSDGRFPNHHPDPSVIDNMKQLQEKVLEHGADLGIGLDGDGDRIGLIDEKGNYVAADTMMAIFWGDLMPQSLNKIALFDVKCSKQLEDEIIRLGGTPFIYRTGNSYQKNKIKEMDLIFGGELSGHVFFRDRWAGFDDGIYAGLRMMELMSKTGKTLSELYAHLNKYESTPEIKIKTTEEKKFKIVESVKQYCLDQNIEIIDIDGVRAKLNDGWILVRASNTGPNLTVRFEATTKERLEELKNEYINLVNKLNEE